MNTLPSDGRENYFSKGITRASQRGSRGDNFFFVDATTQIPNTVRLRKAAKNILWGTREACIPSSPTGLIKLESEILTQFRLTKGYGF